MHELVRYLGICDGNMQEGSFRCDANVSVRPKGQKNSARGRDQKYQLVQIRRKSDQSRNRAADRGDRKRRYVVQETRLYDADKDETRSMRSKEEANDYRYFPDPDLLPVLIDEDFKAQIKAQLPELPQAKKQRL